MRRSQSISLGRCLAVAAVVSLLVLAFGAAVAQANDFFTLDARPETPGRVIEDAAGNAYIAWTDEGAAGAPNVVRYCKVPAGGTCTSPISLPIPGATGSTDSVAGAFPVFAEGHVLVVAPRYVDDDVVVWTSTDGGASFNGGVVSAHSYSNKTDPAGVVVGEGNELLIGASNSGLGFSDLPATGAAGENFTFTTTSGTIESSSLAIGTEGNPVEAYWTIGDPDQVFFYRFGGAGPLAEEGNWAGPSAVADGYEPKLASGPNGLFLVSQDYAAGGSEPTQLDVRKFNGTSFDAPVTLANDSSIDLFAGGAIAEAPNGLLAVAWPGTRSADDIGVMRLFVSDNGGASFSESEVAHIGAAYSIEDNAQLAIGENGSGWLTFIDGSGLHVADLTPISPFVPPAAGTTIPKTYAGKTRVVSTAVGSNLLTLTVPKQCLAPSQSFFIGVGVKARHRIAKSLRSKLKVVKVTFSLDGKKLKTLKKKPFRYLVKPSALAAGSKHTVTARVTAIELKHGHEKKVVRTLVGRVSIC